MGAPQAARRAYRASASATSVSLSPFAASPRCRSAAGRSRITCASGSSPNASARRSACAEPAPTGSRGGLHLGRANHNPHPAVIASQHRCYRPGHASRPLSPPSQTGPTRRVEPARAAMRYVKRLDFLSFFILCRALASFNIRIAHPALSFRVCCSVKQGGTRVGEASHRG